jgi:hypothetical protein
MENFIIYPALLFPAIPLMMTNFTHRYNSCAALIRKIHAEIIEKKINTKDVMGRRYIAQIKTLTYRIKLIKLIQTLSGLALFTNLLTIFFGYIEKSNISLNCFSLAVGLFGLAIILFIIEVQMSAKALEYHLTDLKDKEDSIF